MNVPKAIEIALASVIREYARLPDGVTIRAWQKLTQDATWSAADDRVFPLIDVRCSPPATDDNQSTLRVSCAVLCGTKVDDDRDHETISTIYEEAQGVLDKLFAQFRAQVDGAELARFRALMTANAGASAFQFGGFTFGEPMAPADQGGANMIGTTLTVHYGRSDF